MIMKWVFLLTLWNTDRAEVYVMDYNLTGEDCIIAVESYVQSDEYDPLYSASCEVDNGEPWDELPSTGVFAD